MTSPTIRDNSGTMGRNDKKTKDNHPDVRGQCVINGVEYWISGWTKEGRNGKFVSLAFQPKDQQSGGGQSAKAANHNFDDDDLPF